MTKSSLGRKGFIWLTLPQHSPSLGDLKHWGRTEAETDRREGLLTALFARPCSTCLKHVFQLLKFCMLGICTSCVFLFSTQARIGCQIPGTRASLEMTAIWVLGTELRASAGIASSFSHRAISSAPSAFLFIQPRITCPGVASHNALGPLISIVSQENIPWTWLHTNLTEAFSQLRIPLAT